MFKDYEYFSSHKPKSSYEMIRVMAEGVPVSAVDQLSVRLTLTKQAVCDAVGLNIRTINRREQLKLDEADKLYRLARIFALAIQVLEDEKDAIQWLKNPKIALNNEIPLHLLTTDIGAREVETLLNRIEHGVYS